MVRQVQLGMTKEELIAKVGAPDIIKNDGHGFYYETFNVSIFLDKEMKADRIYLGKKFQGTVSKKDSVENPLKDIFSEFGKPLSTERRTYAPSTSIQAKATVELENKVSEDDMQATSFPMEYRGNRKIYELYNKGMVMKYKYVLDEEGISFWLDHKKDLYATVIYPPKAAPVPELEVEEPEVKVISFEMIHFDFDKSNIKDKYVPVLNKNIAYMKDDESLFVTIEGHTDTIGTDTYNQELSVKRSDSVYSYFIDKGISLSRLKIVGYGELQPIADNRTPEGNDNSSGRARNRRVQFQLNKPMP